MGNRKKERKKERVNHHVIRIYTFIGVYVIMLCCFSTFVESLVTDTDVNDKMINFIVYFIIISFHIDGLMQ